MDALPCHPITAVRRVSSNGANARRQRRHGNGQNYAADFDAITGYTNFDTGTIHVTQGDTVTGSVTFQVPEGVTVSKVQWSALSGFGSTVEWNVHG